MYQHSVSVKQLYEGTLLITKQNSSMLPGKDGGMLLDLIFEINRQVIGNLILGNSILRNVRHERG